MYLYPCVWMEVDDGWMDGWMDERMKGWMLDGWMNGQMDGWEEGWMSRRVFFSPQG